jgi:hypothetical protein
MTTKPSSFCNVKSRIQRKGAPSQAPRQLGSTGSIERIISKSKSFSKEGDAREAAMKRTIE